MQMKWTEIWDKPFTKLWAYKVQRPPNSATFFMKENNTVKGATSAKPDSTPKRWQDRTQRGAPAQWMRDTDML